MDKLEIASGKTLSELEDKSSNLISFNPWRTFGMESIKLFENFNESIFIKYSIEEGIILILLSERSRFLNSAK